MLSRTPTLILIAALISGAAHAQNQQQPETGGMGGQNVPAGISPGGGQAFTDPASLFSTNAGALYGASIGHGTLISRYANSLNLDHTKFGLAFDFNTTYFGVETLVDSIGNPGLIGGRAYVRPFGDTPFLRGWAIGVTGVTDLNAPRNYIDPVTGKSSPGKIFSDTEGNPVVHSDAIQAIGVDTEFEVLHNSLISLIPYIDLNRLVGAGNGLH